MLLSQSNIVDIDGLDDNLDKMENNGLHLSVTNPSDVINYGLNGQDQSPVSQQSCQLEK